MKTTFLQRLETLFVAVAFAEAGESDAAQRLVDAADSDAAECCPACVLTSAPADHTPVHSVH